jgi:hypothetical protein
MFRKREIKSPLPHSHLSFSLFLFSLKAVGMN